jgi:hypothetical protein
VGEIGCNSRNWKVHTAAGAFVLKRADRSRLEMLSLQARINDRFLSRKFPVVRLVPGASGRLVTADGPYAYALSAFVPGARFDGSWAQWTDLLRWVSRLVRFSAADGVPAAFRAAPSRDFFERGETRWIRQAGRAPFGLSSRQIGYLLTLHEVLEAECAPTRPASAVFHVDLHPLNLLFRGGLLRAIVDFDSYRRTGPAFAAGFSVFKCLREVVVRAGGPDALGRVMGRTAPLLGRVFPGIPPRKLLAYGQADVMKRAVFVLRDFFEAGNRQWLPMFPVQLAGLLEIDRMREALA